jgi:riboflavin kinase/FMN adenylyltransferase
LELIHGTAAIERRLVRPVLTIGNFDGVHLGHRAILDKVISRARFQGGEAVLYTFDPHPRRVLRPDRGPEMIDTMDQKVELLEALGLDVLIVETFDLEFAKTSPEVFVREYIHRRIAPLEVYVGYDFHFGKDREGSMRTLTETGPRLGFSVTIISEVTVGDQDVNSSRIRDLLLEGCVEEAAVLLGRAFSLRGPVVKGMQRGRTLGFPTANLQPHNEIVPGPGVYVCEVRFLDEGDPAQGAVLGAVTNVGYRPTFGDHAELTAEAHILDFSADIYDRKVELSFLAQLRPERKFPSPDALREQIAVDVDAASRWLQSSGSVREGAGDEGQQSE